MNIESTDSWTQGLSHTACTTPTPAFTGTLNIPHTKRLLASKSPPFLFSAPVSFFLVLFFNPLNMFWYKNKPTYDESTMLVNCLSLLPSCYCPVLSPTLLTNIRYWPPNPLSSCSRSLHGRLTQSDVVMEVGETAQKKKEKQFDKPPWKKESNKKDFLKKVIKKSNHNSPI